MLYSAINHCFPSLRSRLLAAVFGVLLVFLLLTGVALDRAFEQSLETDVKERLHIHLYGLLAVAEVEDGQLVMPERLAEPRFNTLNSELYAFVGSEKQESLWQSASALSISTGAEPLVFEQPTTAGDSVFSRLDRAELDDMFTVALKTEWEADDSGALVSLIFTVAESSRPYQLQLKGFRKTLYTWLGGLAIATMLVQLMIVVWGLRPIKRLTDDIAKIERGEADDLHNEYLSELRGVANNLNRLIQNEREQRSRYRDRLADLAHSLKTPLAVMQGAVSQVARGKKGEGSDESRDEASLQSMRDQLQTMNQIVRYQLQRAVSVERSLATALVEIPPVVEKITSALKKVYAAKALEIVLDVSGEPKFAGEAGDLTEVLGNVLDNACRLCKTRVAVTVMSLEGDGEGMASRVLIDDDGPGVPENQRDFILKRGVRLDTLNPGQGIGLAVVAEIVESYHGRLSISDNEWGGARFTIDFP